MKKSLVLTASAILLFASCESYTGVGAYAGTSLGSILGSAIGGISGGPRGSDIGTVVGMAGGAVVGAAIGNMADQKRASDLEQYGQECESGQSATRQRHNTTQYGDDSVYNSSSSDSGFDDSNSGDDRIYDFNGSDYTSNTTTQEATTKMPDHINAADLSGRLSYTPSIEIRNARFIDDNNDGVIQRNEISKVIFEVVNIGSQTLYDVQPTVIEATGNRHIFISPSIHVEKIMPGKGIRYTAMIKADNRLKDGSVKICVSVLQGDKAMSKVSEFNIPTKK